MNYQQELIKEYEEAGYIVLKIIRLNKAGYPDLMLLKDGEVIFVEVKEANDTLRELQKKRIDELNNNGFKSYCIQKGKGIIY